MDLILIHLGPTVPAHLFTCVEQIRRVTDGNIFIGMSGAKNFLFKDEDTYTIDLDKIEKPDNWKRFIEVQHLDGFEMDSFWRYACERFYAIQTIMEFYGLEKALHIENDNLIYGEPDTEFLEHWCGNGIGLTEINETLLSAGVMYIGSQDGIRTLNEQLNALMGKGKETLDKEYPGEMMNEMRLLKIVQELNEGLISNLPIFPTLISKYVYDCASWGQYVGGTHQEPGIPYKGSHHFIGRELIKGDYDVEFIKGRPHIKILKPMDDAKNPVFNLHIHSKQLERWAK